MADKALDARKLKGMRDRITDWGLQRSVDDYLAENINRPDLCKNTKVAESLMKRPEIRAAIGKAIIRPVDIQVYVTQRRLRQEENADKALVEGPAGKVLTNTLAERVRRFMELGAMVDAVLPESLAVVQELQRQALKAAKEGKDLPAGYKTSWQVMKTGFDMMSKGVDMLKGDNTLQNILKAQTINQTIIRGIPPEELPKRILDLLQHVQCPRCRKGDWSRQETLKVYAQASASMATKGIVDAEYTKPSKPIPEVGKTTEDDEGPYYDGEYRARR